MKRLSLGVRNHVLNKQMEENSPLDRPIWVALSDETEVINTKWADIKEHAMKDGFKTESLYTNATETDQLLLDRLINAQTKQKDMKELQHTVCNTQIQSTDIKFEDDLKASTNQESPKIDRDTLIKGLRETNTQYFDRKFHFERGQYHQCIPNPKVKGGFITVQLVNRQTTICTHEQSQKDDKLHFCKKNYFKRYKFKYDHKDEQNSKLQSPKPKSRGSYRSRTQQTFKFNSGTILEMNQESSSSESTERERMTDKLSVSPLLQSAKSQQLKRLKVSKANDNSKPLLQQRLEPSQLKPTKGKRSSTVNVRRDDKEGEDEVGGMITTMNSGSEFELPPIRRGLSPEHLHDFLGDLENAVNTPDVTEDGSEMVDIDQMQAPNLNKLYSSGLPTFHSNKESTQDGKLYAQQKDKFDHFLDEFIQKIDKVDPLKGVESLDFASIQQKNSIMLGQVSKIAVIGYWKFNESTSTINCEDYFYLPYPMTRQICSSQDNSVEQFLYRGRNGEIFCFFDNSYKKKTKMNTFSSMSLCILDIEATEDSVAKKCGQNYAEMFKPEYWGEVTSVPTDSALAHYVYYLDMKSFESQEQLPNLHMDEVDKKDGGKRKLIVFTSYQAPHEEEEESNTTSYSGILRKSTTRNAVSKRIKTFKATKSNLKQKNQFPSIFFYDIEEARVVWFIYQAWVFLRNDEGKIWYMNHEYINSIEWLTMPSKDEMKHKNDQQNAPAQQLLDSYVINGKHCQVNFKNTVNKSRVVEAILHPDKQRVTIAFHNFGSFTYLLRQKQNLDTCTNSWTGIQNERPFGCQLQLNSSQTGVAKSDHNGNHYFQSEGEGDDIDGAKFHLNLKIWSEQQQDATWFGYTTVKGQHKKIEFTDFTMEKLNAEHLTSQNDSDSQSSEALKQSIFYEEQLKIIGNGKDRDRGEFSVFGIVSLEEEDDPEESVSHMIEFKQLFIEDQKSVEFKGVVNKDLTKIEGVFTDDFREISGTFLMQKDVLLPASIKKKYISHTWKNTQEIQGIYLENEKEFRSLPNQEHSFEMSTKAHVANAHLIYYIDKPDARICVRAKLGNEGYPTPMIQGKLQSTSSRPDGYTNAEICLFYVDEPSEMSVQQIKEAENNLRTMIGCEPKKFDRFEFLLHKSFEQAKQEGANTIIRSMPVKEVGDHLIGSVIYENKQQNILNLSYFTAQNIRKDDKSLQISKDQHHPQNPTGQEWTVQYPILAYKSFTPDDEELVFINMAVDTPHQFVSILGWEFICFVEHHEKSDITIYEAKHQKTIDIMFLVRRAGHIRLMSYKTDPWFYQKDPEGVIDKGIYLPHTTKIKMFTGVVQWPNDTNKESIGKRLRKEMIRCCHLLTQKRQNQHQFAIVIQFEDRIVVTWLKDKSEVKQQANQFKDFTTISQPDQMAKLKMIRGTADKIFYAESNVQCDKVMMLEFNENIDYEIIVKEVYSLINNRIVLLGIDCDSYESQQQQAFYVVNDQQKILLITNGIDGEQDRFDVDNELNIAHHGLEKEMRALSKHNWTQVHISQRAIAFNGYTYSINSQLKYEINLSQELSDKTIVASQTWKDFKEQAMAQDFRNSAFYETLLENERVLIDALIEAQTSQGGDSQLQPTPYGNSWKVHESQVMSNTSNLIAITSNKDHNYSFLVKPAPGKRRNDLICNSQFAEVKQMTFVSNHHILLRFTTGVALTLEISGKVISQSNKVQDILDNNYAIVSHTLIDRSKCKAHSHKQHLLNESNTYNTYMNSPECSRLFIFEYRSYTNDPHKDFKVLCFGPNGKGEILLEHLNHQQCHSQMMETQFKYESRSMKNKFDVSKMCADSKLHFKEIRFIKTQVLVSIAIFQRTVTQIQASAEANPSDRTPETFDSIRTRMQSMVTTNQGSAYKTRMHVAKVKDFFQRMSNPNKKLEMLLVNYQVDTDHEYKMMKDAKFVLVGSYFVIKRKDENFVRIIDLDQADEDGYKADETLGNFKFRSIDIESMLSNSDKDMNISLRALPESNLKIIKGKHGMMYEDFTNVLQISVGNNSKLFELDNERLREISYLEDLDRFGSEGCVLERHAIDTKPVPYNPEGYINTGYIQTHISPSNGNRLMILANEMSDYFIKRSVTQDKSGETKMAWDQVSIYRTFSEIDLHEIEFFNGLVTQFESESSGKQQNVTILQQMRDIDKSTLQCIFNGQTVFSMFFKVDLIYNQIHKQLDEIFSEVSKDHMSATALHLYASRLLEILRFPVQDIASEQEEETGSVLVWLRTFPSLMRLRRYCLRLPKRDLSVGYKSILKKSVHQKNTQWMDYLMNFASFSEDNSIESFVESLEELKILVALLSPTVAKFFESCFITTNNSKSIQRVQWNDSQTGFQLVIRKADSHVSENDINQKQGIFSSSKMYYKNVGVTILRTDWIYSMGTGMDDLVIAMSQANNELFKTDLFNVLIGGFWMSYSKRVVFFGFIPWVIYTMLSLFYLSHFLNPEGELTWASHFILVPICLLNLYFGLNEGYQAHKLRYYYITSWTNLFQVLKVVLLQFIIFNEMTHFKYQRIEMIRRLGICSMIFLYLDIFYWFKISDKFAIVVRVLQNTIGQVKIFMTLLLLVVLMFTNIVYLINQSRQGSLEGHILNQNSSIFGRENESSIGPFFEAFLTQYLISLGTFNTTSFAGEEEFLIWGVFLAATFILQIVFLNMLIALMSLTFDNTIHASHEALKEKIGIIADYSWINWQRNDEQVNYMFSVKPLDHDFEEAEEYVSRIRQIKRELVKSQKKVLDAVKKQGHKIINGQNELAKIIEKEGGSMKKQVMGRMATTRENKSVVYEKQKTLVRHFARQHGVQSQNFQ